MHIESDVFTILIFMIRFTGIAGFTGLITDLDMAIIPIGLLPGIGDGDITDGIHHTIMDGDIRIMAGDILITAITTHMDIRTTDTGVTDTAIITIATVIMPTLTGIVMVKEEMPIQV